MKKSDPGPRHEAALTTTPIEGVLLMQVPTVHYEFGGLSEIFNPEWDTIFDEPIEHMYVITNSANTREHWHVHLHTIDRYVLISGQIEIALFDNREDSGSNGVVDRVVLNQVGTSGFHGLKIPAGVWHTFRSDSASFTLLNNKYPKYDRENPDKYSIAFGEAPIHFSW